MTKQEKITQFDPSQPGASDGNLYGLPFTSLESDIIVIPAPLEVTVSYGDGASHGPNAILEASYQVDLSHQQYPDLWQLGIFLDEPDAQIIEKNNHLKTLAKFIIDALENGEIIDTNHKLYKTLQEINHETTQLKDIIKKHTLQWLNHSKSVILLGGDHSTPLGFYEAIGEKFGSFGILQFDAHLDLRNAYEGFTHSHASIMFNAIQLPYVEKLVQVGIRDFCADEINVVKQNPKIKVFSDADLKNQLFEGQNWKNICNNIISQLPQNVIISFDIDALQKWYCPNTGTPVPGGLSYEQCTYLIDKLAHSGKKIIAADLVEVAPGDDDWDGNVGARLLFHLCGAMAFSQGKNTGQSIDF